MSENEFGSSRHARKAMGLAAGCMLLFANVSTSKADTAVVQNATPPTPMSLTLDDAYRAALAHQYKSQNLVIDQATANVIDAQGAKLPTTAVTAHVNDTSSSTNDVAPGDGGGGLYNDKARVGLTTDLPLYDGGQIDDSVKSARFLLESARAASQSEDITIVESVTAAYFDSLEAQADVDVDRDALQQTQDQLTAAQARLKLGTVTPIDVLTAQSAVGATQATLEQANYQLQASIEQLAVLMGVPSNSANFTLETPPDESSETIAAPDLLSHAKTFDPEQRHLTYQLDAAVTNLSAVRAKNKPFVSAYAGSGFTLDHPGSSGEKGQPYLEGGIGIIIPVFQSREQKAAERDQQDQIALNSQNIVDYDNQLTANITDDVFQFNADQAQISAINDSLTSAQQAYDLASQRYQVGVGTQTDVLAAVQNLTATKNDLAKARLDCNLVLSRLRLETGDKPLSDIDPSLAPPPPQAAPTGNK